MDELVWGAVIASIVLIVAGVLVWWLASGCVRTLIGAVGAVIGAMLSLVPLLVLPDQDVALRLSFALKIVTVVWLLGWVLAGALRAQRLDREAAAMGAAQGAAPMA